MTKRKDPRDKLKVGRPTKYIPGIHNVLIPELFRLGMIDKEVCKKIGIDESVLYDWYKRHPELAKAKKAKKEPNLLMEQALIKNGLGHHIKETEISGDWDQETNKFKGKTRAKIIDKYINPNTTAQIFFLKNRWPERYRDKQIIEHEGMIADLKVPLDPEEKERVEKELNRSYNPTLLKQIKKDLSS